MSNINDFLESYFIFQTNKGLSVDEFEKVAISTLVNTGQVSKEELASFMQTKKIDQEIAKKTLEIAALESKIKQLEKEIVMLKKQKPTVINKTIIREQPREVVERDSCGHPINPIGHVEWDPCGRSSSTHSRSC